MSPEDGVDLDVLTGEANIHLDGDETLVLGAAGSTARLSTILRMPSGFRATSCSSWSRQGVKTDRESNSRLATCGLRGSRL
jgi:hypothetical protein